MSFAVHGKLLSAVFPPALTCGGDLNEEVLLSQWMLARTFTAVKYGFRLFFLLQTFNKPSAWEKYKLTDVFILPAPKKMLNPTLVPQKKKSHIGLREMSGA